MSLVFYVNVVFSKVFFSLVCHIRKNPTLRNLTLEKHFMKNFNYKKDKLNIIFFQKYFSYPFNIIMKLFFTIVYLRIITLTLIFHDHPLVEYPFVTKEDFISLLYDVPKQL